MRNDRTERKRIRESFGAACGMPMRAVAAGRAAKQGAGARPRQVLQIVCVLLLALRRQLEETENKREEGTAV